MKESAHILLESAPAGFDREAVQAALIAEIDGLNDVSHVHAWSVTQERPMITLEARIDDNADATRIKDSIRAILNDRFNIDHAVIEVTKSTDVG